MRRFPEMALRFFAALLTLWPALALAQGTVQQSGPVGAQHLAMYIGNGRVVDAGGPPGRAQPPANQANPGTLPTGLGVVNNNLGFANFSGYSGNPYSEFLWGMDYLGTGDGLIKLDRVGGGGPLTLWCEINGVRRECFGTGGIASITGEHGVYTTPSPITSVGVVGCNTISANILGCAKVDGTTIVADVNGVISAAAGGCSIATIATIGCVKPDGTSITITEDGTISASGVAGCTEDGGTEGQVCNSTGGGGAVWGSRVIGAPGASAGDNGAPVTISGGAGGGASSSSGDTQISGGPGDNLARPGTVSIYTKDADPASSWNGSGIAIYTGAGHTSGTSADIDIFTGSTPSGGSGELNLSTGAVTNDDWSSGQIEIKTGNSQASGAGNIILQTGSAVTASSPNASGKIRLTAWGNATFQSLYRGQSLDFTDHTGDGFFYGGLTVSGALYDGSAAGSAGTGTERNFLIQGELYGGDGGTPTARNGGNLWIAGGGTTSIENNPTYNGNHTGNLYLTGGYNVNPAQFDTGNVVFVSAQADQSQQVGSSGASITVATSTGTLLLDGVNSTFTITLPRAPQNGRMVHVTTHGAIGTLTVSAPGGATVLGAPASLSADAGFSMIYRTANTSWYRYY